MAKKKKKEEKPQIQEIKADLVHLDVYFAIKGVREHHKAGMRAYNGAHKLKMEVKDWDKFFKNY